MSPRNPLRLPNPKGPKSPSSQKTKGRILFVIGGASSGKSELALTLCGNRKPRAFIATCQIRDSEMATKVVQHQNARQGQWDTIEVPVDLAGWFSSYGRNYKGVVLDCLTLWLSNLLDSGIRTDAVLARVDELMDAVRVVPGRVILVSNELGLGLVPGDAGSRCFRDLAGKINQRIAQAVDEVYLSVSGLPLKLK